jgi:hypothetical protein
MGLAFAGFEFGDLRLVEQEGVIARLVPKLVVFIRAFFHAINNLDTSDDAANLKIREAFRQAQVVPVFFKTLVERVPQGSVFLLRHAKLLAGMNKHATAHFSLPSPVFDRFYTVNDKPRPRLANAKCFHAPSLSGMKLGVNNTFG